MADSSAKRTDIMDLLQDVAAFVAIGFFIIGGAVVLCAF